MKKLIFFLSLFAIFFNACKKDDGIYYNINGLKDVVYKYDTLRIPLNIEFREGNQEYVQLSLEGLPTNMVANFSTNGGIPNFETVLHLSHKGLLQEGSYNISVVGTNAKGKRRIAQFKLSLLEGCGYSLAGRYRYSYIYKGDTNLFDFVVLNPDPNDPHKLIVRDELSKTMQFYLMLNCKDATVDYPLQLQVSGKGFYTLEPKKHIQIEAAYPDGRFDNTILLDAY